jgi:RNA polymerase sigma factor (TIGR02999 family)
MTPIFEAIQRGDAEAQARLLPLVYGELRRIAAGKMAAEPAGQTLQTTALVHEAWLRLGGNDQQAWQNRAHFFTAAAEAMRRILIDRARKKQAERHGGGQRPESLAESRIAAPLAGDDDEQLLAVSAALDKLAAQDREKAELVKLRYYAGMTIEEAAKVLGVSERTAKRHWTYARAWLFREVREK